MATTTYKIPAQNMGLLTDKVAQINKKIEKINKKNDAGQDPRGYGEGA